MISTISTLNTPSFVKIWGRSLQLFSNWAWNGPHGFIRMPQNREKVKTTCTTSILLNTAMLYVETNKPHRNECIVITKFLLTWKLWPMHIIATASLISPQCRIMTHTTVNSKLSRIEISYVPLTVFSSTFILRLYLLVQYFPSS